MLSRFPPAFSVYCTSPVHSFVRLVSVVFAGLHGLHGEFVSALANDPSVNLSETMAAARHKTAAASAVYQQCSHQSEANRINSLLKKGNLRVLL